ncbi:hypothetical protein GH733_019134 [Mirounga leonina]|nr:hypothetical protein GH733_019134 [Mirounga leonina]
MMFYLHCPAPPNSFHFSIRVSLDATSPKLSLTPNPPTYSLSSMDFHPQNQLAHCAKRASCSQLARHPGSLSGQSRRSLISRIPNPACVAGVVRQLPSIFLGSRNRTLRGGAAVSTIPPMFDPNEIKVLDLRRTGREVGAMSALAPKISPPPPTRVCLQKWLVMTSPRQPVIRRV